MHLQLGDASGKVRSTGEVSSWSVAAITGTVSSTIAPSCPTAGLPRIRAFEDPDARLDRDQLPALFADRVGAELDVWLEWVAHGDQLVFPAPAGACDAGAKDIAQDVSTGNAATAVETASAA